MAEGKETIGGRIRNLLSLNRSGTSKTPPSTANKQSLISHEFWLDVGASAPLEQRLEKIKEASKLVECEILQDSIIKKLWIETKDLLQSKMNHDVRLTELGFLRSIIKGQYRRLGILRTVFFQALQDHTIPEDGPAIVQTFETLSENGKDVELFEQEVGPLLLTWMKNMKGNTTLLFLLINIIKFNSAYLDQDVIVEILAHVCELCNTKSPEQEKELALQVVEAVICYSSLPHESLYPVTVMLCHILNLKKFCNESWKLMRKLLGTHLGHSCILTMCYILQNPKMLPEWPLLRSAVFFIGMGLWGSVRVTTLKHTPQSVLPSFLCALHTKNLELAFEVTLTIQRLVRKFGHELQAGAWDHVLDIVSTLLDLMEETMPQGHLPAAISLRTGTHELITFIEKLYESEVYDGSIEKLFCITERCSVDRGDESVFLLIAFKSQAINPTKQNWISNLLMLMDSFYTRESRSTVRLKTLEVLWSVVEACMELYEEEIVIEVLMTCFVDIHEEVDLAVKTRAVRLLVHSCLIYSETCLHLFSLLQKILNHGWKKRVSSATDIESNNPTATLADIEELVLGLVDIFKQKMPRYPGTHSAQVFHLLTSFLEQFYSFEDVAVNNECLIESRKQAFNLLLSLRANEKGQLCISRRENSSDSDFTSYLLIGSQSNSDAGDGIGHISYDDVMECVLLCLKKETCWVVLNSVFEGLCGVSQNKTILIGSGQPQSPHGQPRSAHLEEIAKTLCSLMTDSDLARRKLFGLPSDYVRSDIQASILSVLSYLASYHGWLEVARQRQILRCLEAGFTSRCARQCIGALTLCLAEMPRDTLLRVLPSVLLRLSQMSATVHMSTAILELLATLAQLPRLYSNFVEDQYMSVFVVALQYTNPSKFSRYVVSLAHYVIGTWFAKCRMSFRPDFVSLITKHLHAANRRGTHAEDGSAVDVIRNDLMETCIDMMARYTFSNCSTPPRRSPLARFLFDNGPSCTWLVGNKLITITTSDVEISSEKISSPSPPLAPSTPSSTLWPKPSKKYFDRQLSSEAPGKLQTNSFSGSSSSPRQRHKSGGAVLRRSLHLSPFEDHHAKSGGIHETTKQKLDFQREPTCQPKASQLKYILTKGWAEIYIRRPSGNTAWSMRIQNQLESITDESNIEDVLNLQSFLKEIQARNMEQIQEFQEEEMVTAPITDSQNEQEETKTENPSNGYMDVLTSHKDESQGDVKENTEVKSEAPKKPASLRITDTKQKTNEHTAFTPPPVHSTQLPIIRHRSHTVSTSKDCAVEAAAISAKRAVELRKSTISSKDAHGHSFSGAHANTSFNASPDGRHKYLDNSDKQETTEHMLHHRHTGVKSPCFVFLQLFQSAISTESIHRPILLPVTPGIERGIQVLDRIPHCDTWATGVVYVGVGQGADGAAILANQCGSPRYQDLLNGLGELVCLTDCDPSSTFLSGLDTTGEDGEFTYLWRQDVAQMVFHVTTLMPNRSSDSGCKKRHIGNDYVMIAYDDDRGRYVPGCVVQGQFRSAEIIVKPLDHKTNHVRYVFHKECVERAIGDTTGPWLVSDLTLPIFIRQLALHANMAAYVCLGEGRGAGEYTSKVLARLKQIKRIRARALQEEKRDVPSSSSTGMPRQTRSDQNIRENGNTVECHKLEEFSDYTA